MKKRILSIALVLCMMLSVMPTAFAAGENAKVYIGGTEYTDSTNLPTGVTIDWNAKKITLDNASVSREVTTKNDATTLEAGSVIAGIAIDDGKNTWTLELKNSSTISAKNAITTHSTEFIPAVGVYASGTLKITGDGTLNAEASFAGPSSMSSRTLCGVYAYALEVESGTINAESKDTIGKNGGFTMVGAVAAAKEIKVSGGNVAAKSNLTNSYGAITVGMPVVGTPDESDVIAEGYGTLTITGGTVTADISSVQASGNNRVMSTGVFALNVAVSGGSFEVKGCGEDSDGIWAVSEVEITGGEVKISNFGEKGIETQNLTITGTENEETETKVTISSETEGSSGIYLNTENNSSITISAETVSVSVPDGDNAIAILGGGDDVKVDVSSGAYKGIVYVSGSTTTEVEISGETTVNGDITTGKNASVEISGGSVSGSVTTGTGSTVTVSGDTTTISGDITTGGGDNSSLTISGGSVGGAVTAGEGTETNITGGSFAEPVKADYTGEGAVLVKGTDEEGNTTYTIYENKEAATEDGVDEESVTEQFTVTFVNGNESSSVKAFNGDVLTLDTPTYDGYRFAGWKDSAPGGQTYTGSYTASGNVTLTAQWVQVFTVTFNSDGGTAVAAQTVDSGATATTPTAPTKDGYVFQGWYNGETRYNFATPVTADLTLTAKWTVYTPPVYGDSDPTYSVTTEDADNGSVKLNKKYAEAGETVTLTVKPDAGYELESLTVTDRKGNEIKLTDNGDGTYTFKMPVGKVEIEAVFAEIEPENPFVDVEEDAYYYDAVLWAAENGITGGTSATTFSPAAACTRAQTVTFLWRAAGSPEPETAVSPFEDVDPSAYYYKAVLWAAEQGITGGTSATTFSPDATVTRSQNVTFLWRMAGSPAAEQTASFGDVAADSYFHDAVVWAADEAITSGTSATTFSPADPCLRSQIVTFLYRYYVD